MYGLENRSVLPNLTGHLKFHFSCFISCTAELSMVPAEALMQCRDGWQELRFFDETGNVDIRINTPQDSDP